MNLNGQIVFSYIEEDNTQKGFFRVRPLLCSNGLLTEDDIKEYPDDCYLRVVPDRNEQHTFKDRMREILHFCLIDLKDNKPEYSKIRNNKNYAPQREENNRFIIYSDAVRALRNDFFYDIVSEEELSSSVTPHAFVRAGGCTEKNRHHARVLLAVRAVYNRSDTDAQLRSCAGARGEREKNVLYG